MITLSLLHPIQSIPVQSWTFEHEPVIRIGRATDNEVILYSAVVSRHHIEIRRNGDDWEVVNVGTNGTYIDGKKINKTTAVDGMILRLAYSGPKIQIRLDRANGFETDLQNNTKEPPLNDLKEDLVNEMSIG